MHCTSKTELYIGPNPKMRTNGNKLKESMMTFIRAFLVRQTNNTSTLTTNGAVENKLNNNKIKDEMRGARR